MNLAILPPSSLQIYNTIQYNINIHMRYVKQSDDCLRYRRNNEMFAVADAAA